MSGIGRNLALHELGHVVFASVNRASLITVTCDEKTEEAVTDAFVVEVKGGKPPRLVKNPDSIPINYTLAGPAFVLTLDSRVRVPLPELLALGLKSLAVVDFFKVAEEDLRLVRETIKTSDDAEHTEGLLRWSMLTALWLDATGSLDEMADHLMANGTLTIKGPQLGRAINDTINGFAPMAFAPTLMSTDPSGVIDHILGLPAPDFDDVIMEPGASYLTSGV